MYLINITQSNLKTSLLLRADVRHHGVAKVMVKGGQNGVWLNLNLGFLSASSGLILDLILIFLLSATQSGHKTYQLLAEAAVDQKQEEQQQEGKAGPDGPIGDLN